MGYGIEMREYRGDQKKGTVSPSNVSREAFHGAVQATSAREVALSLFIQDGVPFEDLDKLEVK